MTGSDEGVFEAARTTRRGFLIAAAATAAASSAAATAPLFGVRPGGEDVLRVGVVGCGGRGTGAALNALDAHPSVKIVALGDAFAGRLASARGHLKNAAAEDPKAYGGRCDVADDKCFVGLDAYRRVIASGIDLVILATPPGFRPDHILSAAEAGLHVFAEKPVAVDPVGIRKVLKAADVFDAAKTSFVAGTQRRHQASYLEFMRRVHEEKAIGEIVTAQVWWNQGSLWKTDRTEAMSDLEWQMKNWLYFTWLSGDHIVEQHVHNIDVMCWAMGGPPTKAVASGGRQARVDPAFGHVYDHFAVDYEWADGRHASSYCRQIEGAASHVGEDVQGTAGRGRAGERLVATDGRELWRRKGDEDDPFVREHADLVAAIRSGKPLNEARRIADSTLTAIMGRMSAYTGQVVTRAFALDESKLDTFPTDLSGPLPVPPVAIPGKLRLV